MSLFLQRYQAGLRWLPALCFAIAIFFFSSAPGDEIYQSYHRLETTVQAISPTLAPGASSAPTTASVLLSLDWLKVAHGVGYFCLGVSVLYALSARSRWSPIMALILCFLYSITDEIHQGFVPQRSASVTDVLLDTLAALIGVALMLGVRASRNYFSKIRP